MGKKARKEREEKRESFAAQRSKQKRKTYLMAGGVLAVVVAIVAFSAYNFATNFSNAPGAPPGAGMLGGEHVHSSILVKIFGDKFDFSLPAYQIKSSWIHFEAQDGTTIHRHAEGVTLGYLFDTLSIEVSDECFIFPDGRQFCTNEDYTLKYYVNHEQVSGIYDYVFNDEDRILISYGSETPEEIEEQLRELDSQQILA
ncbi:MAG: protein-disulfide isomerase [Crenarchaeota archaeon]|nr:MAG: protein-disulfide isomerase [Thermoproteota archaeon]RDJ34212.1 MAG: protein-disulfide isomerase [Thermoproteota archaeon]RDJ36674.1 MAG: protein-disulfide isomerase [Thermoproteota archaeon]RDJ37795.1 MAG: protein-disulfide isomerase [Thermoproteota archaeon]